MSNTSLGDRLDLLGNQYYGSLDIGGLSLMQITSMMGNSD